MDFFLILGAIGLVLVVFSLFVGDVLDGLFDALDLGSGILSAPVIGGFLAAFGFTAWRFGPLAGVGGGVLVGTVAALLMRAAMRIRTDATPRSRDLVGKPGVLVSDIPEGGFGRVRVSAYGQQLQLNASADRAIPAGTRVVIVTVTSPTAVLVSPLDL